MKLVFYKAGDGFGINFRLPCRVAHLAKIVALDTNQFNVLNSVVSNRGMMDDEENQEAVKRCTSCRRNLDLGVDVLAVVEGVMGPRGLVRLEESLFCSEECLKVHFCDAKPDFTLRRRVP